MQTKQLCVSVQLHPLGQHAAGGDGSQLGLGAVGAGHQHDRHLGAQDDTGVLGVAEQIGGFADAVAFPAAWTSPSSKQAPRTAPPPRAAAPICLPRMTRAPI